MNKCNIDFLTGMFIAIIAIAAILLLKSLITNEIRENIEKAKTEHLTITYKNNKFNIVDKEMLVNIMKQHFPSSNWSYVDTKADKNYIELRAWSTNNR